MGMERMELKKKEQNRQRNNRGSALIMVIVVVAFITILATTLLYVSGTNYYRKTTDIKTKESFYEAETALEEIRAAMALEVSKAAKEAYREVAVNYATADSATRYSLYQNVFFDTLTTNWTNKTIDPLNPSVPIPYEEVVRSLVTNPPDIDYRSSISLKPLEEEPYAGQIEAHPEAGYAVLKGVVLQYTDLQGYTTIITTDYLISIPQINWGVDGSNMSAPAPDVAINLERNEIDMTDYVQYYNWLKK